MSPAVDRNFLFLQGPHGPAVRRLAAALSIHGAGVQRLAFNAGDAAAWGDAGPLHRFTDRMEALPDLLAQIMDGHAITDIVVYGDTRPQHRMALAAARARGIATHCLEEGYIRPHWVTYERQGTNGNSRLMQISLPAMTAALGDAGPPEPADDRWGDSREHLLASALYHARVMLPSIRWRRWRSHRSRPLAAEAAAYLSRGLTLPVARLAAEIARARLLATGDPWHLCLLQLSFDSSMQDHSRFADSADFLDEVMAGFAAGAPADHRLVLKAHPFEDRVPRLARLARRLAARHGLSGRVVLLDGSMPLAPLLDGARTAVTVNSTAGQAALSRGLPLAALGRAVYCKPGLVTAQPLAEFFARPQRPDLRTYWLYRRFLTETSQIPGSFYGRRGIARLMTRLPALMLAPEDPYDRLLSRPAGLAPLRPALGLAG